MLSGLWPERAGVRVGCSCVCGCQGQGCLTQASVLGTSGFSRLAQHTCPLAGASAAVLRVGQPSACIVQKFWESGGSRVLGGSILSPGQLRALVQAAAVKLAYGSAEHTLYVFQAKAAAPSPGNHPVPTSCVHPLTSPACPWCYPRPPQQEKGGLSHLASKPPMECSVRLETWASCSPSPASPLISSVTFGSCPDLIGRSGEF